MDIIVLVGAQEKRFTVHKNVITGRSAFFRAAVEGPFKEAEEKTVRLPEIDPDLFSVYLQWIYSDKIVILGAGDIAKDTGGSKQRALLIELYILADALDDRRLRNRTTDEFIDLCRSTSWPGCKSIKRIWNSTPEGSKLRKLLIDYEMSKKRTSGACWIERNRKSLPKSFMSDLAIAFAKTGLDKRKVTNPRFASPLIYHDHDGDDTVAVGL